MGTDGCRGVAVPLRRWVPDVLAILPAHLFRAPYLEVLTLLLLQDVSIAIARVLGPTTEHNNVAARNIQSVSVSCFWRKARDSEAGPNESVSIEHSYVVHITTLHVGALVESAGLELSLAEFETSVDDQVVSDQDACVALSGSRRRTTAIWSLPSHDFEVQNINVIEIVFAVPATEYVHFGAADDVGRVVEPRRRSTSASGPLVPSHRYWVKSMKVLERSVFAALSSENDDSRTGQES